MYDLAFPLIYDSKFITVELVNKYSLLYTVTGSNNGNKLPYLLAAHIDVVPASPDNWEVDPFAGLVVNNTYIYGRGALDDKGGLMVIIFVVL